MDYLTNIPSIVEEHGFCKTLTVRREMIQIKHIFTEIFVRQTIDINKVLELLDIDLFTYMKYMTRRIRRLHLIDREFKEDCNNIVKHDRDRFFPTINLFNHFNNTIILDFDGVITDKTFYPLYNLCLDKSKVEVCSANPTITSDWFEKKGLLKPDNINSMKGKKKKVRKLLELATKYDFLFYVDNEVEYLDYAWLFGIYTFHWDGKQIKHYSNYTNNDKRS